MKKKNARKIYIAAFISTIAICFCIAVSVAWLYQMRSMVTATSVIAPYKLYIGAGNMRAIEELYMGGIDVDANNTDGTRSKDYVFCVYGSPAVDYKIQLAHTTNIGFNYTIYKAGTPGNVRTSLTDAEFITADGTKYYFARSLDAGGNNQIVLSQANAINSDNLTLANDRRSYSESDLVQKNAKAIYLQSADIRPTSSENVDNEFVHYYILRVNWDGRMKNTKETDIIYLTVEGI